MPMIPENFQSLIRRSEKIMNLFPEMRPDFDYFVCPDKGLYLFISPIGVQWRCLPRGRNGFNPKVWSWDVLEERQRFFMQTIMPGCEMLYTNSGVVEKTEYRIYLFAQPETFRLVNAPTRRILILGM